MDAGRRHHQWMDPVMTRNSNSKKPARAYKSANPGITYPAALRSTATPSTGTTVTGRSAGTGSPYPLPLTVYEVLKRAVDGDRQILEHDLEISLDAGPSDFYVNLGPEIEEGPIVVDDVDIDASTMDYDEAEEFEDGTSIGEVRVSAVVQWSGPVYKPTYYGAPDDVQWTVIDPDLNEHYVEVAGEFETELVFDYTVIPGEDSPDTFTLTRINDRT